MRKVGSYDAYLVDSLDCTVRLIATYTAHSFDEAIEKAKERSKGGFSYPYSLEIRPSGAPPPDTAPLRKRKAERFSPAPSKTGAGNSFGTMWNCRWESKNGVS